jgi:tetratricopeptide (TPR) repeat protein
MLALIRQVKVLFLLFFFLSMNGYGQSRKDLDSLMRIYKSKAPRDTNFVIVLNGISRIQRATVPDTAIRFAKDAHALAMKLNYERGVATALNFIGVGYFYKAEYKTDQDYQEKALEYSKQHELKIHTSNALNSLALSHQYQGNYAKAFECYLQALHIEEQSKNYAGQLKVLANLGIFWRRQEDYPKVIEYSERALRLADSVKDSDVARANILTTLGNTYITLKQFKKAQTYFEDALKLYRKVDARLPVIVGINNLGFCQLTIKNFDKAEAYFMEALRLNNKDDAPVEKTLSLNNLAEVYLETKRPTQALPLANQAISLAMKTGHKENILEIYKTLASIYQALGNSSTAYDYLIRAMKLNDSLRSADVTARVSALQKSYELEKKQAEITLLEKDAALHASELKQERNLRYGLFFLLGGLSILALTIFYAFRLKNSLSRKLQRQNEIIESVNDELRDQALRAQMNPHFIFNALNSILYLIVQKQTERSVDYLSKFASLLRQVMENSEKNWIALEDEVKILKLYLDLEALRFSEAFSYQIKNEAEAGLKIPPLLIQPYAENAIRHGLLPKAGEKKLEILFSSNGGHLFCEVKDNGIGRHAAGALSERKLFSSKGMKYTAGRIRMLNTSGGKSSVAVEDLTENGKPSGTLVKISLDL